MVKESSPPLVITAFGASIVQGSKENNFEDLLQARLSKSLNKDVIVHNRGIRGQTTINGLARIRSELAETNPEYILITLGTNDAMLSAPLQSTTSNMDSIISICLGHQTKPILSTLTGLDTLKHVPVFSKNIMAINIAYGKIAQKYQIPFINLYSLVNGQTALFVDDGLHLNAKGYQILAEEWHKIILQELKK